MKNQKEAKADWAGFAAEVHDALTISEKEVRSAVAFILNQPPKKQINVNNRIEWDNTPPNAKNETELVLRYICRVRNNLFHGGKFNGRWFQPERSGELMQASLIILNFSREACPDVDQAYRG